MRYITCAYTIGFRNVSSKHTFPCSHSIIYPTRGLVKHYEFQQPYREPSVFETSADAIGANGRRRRRHVCKNCFCNARTCRCQENSTYSAVNDIVPIDPNKAGRDTTLLWIATA